MQKHTGSIRAERDVAERDPERHQPGSHREARAAGERGCDHGKACDRHRPDEGRARSRANGVDDPAHVVLPDTRSTAVTGRSHARTMFRSMSLKARRGATSITSHSTCLMRARFVVSRTLTSGGRATAGRCAKRRTVDELATSVTISAPSPGLFPRFGRCVGLSEPFHQKRLACPSGLSGQGTVAFFVRG